MLTPVQQLTEQQLGCCRPTRVRFVAEVSMLSNTLFRGVASEAELQQLKLLMLDGDKRIEFLEELELQCQAVRVLDNRAYNTMCDVLGELVEESEYDEDYDALLRIFKLSSRIGIALQTSTLAVGHTITCKSSFEASYWSNEMFWTQSIVDMVRKDMNLWAKIKFIIKENKIKDIQLFGDMSASEIRAFFVVTRIQSMIPSLRSLDLSNDFITTVLQEVSAQFGFNNVGIDISTASTTRASEAFLLRVLTSASQLFLPALCARALEALQQQTRGGMQPAGTLYATLKLDHSRVEFVPSTHSAPQHHVAGYSPLLEVIFSLYIHAIQAHPRGIATAGTVSEEKALLQPVLSLSGSNGCCATTCICGGAISKWMFLNAHRTEEGAISPKLSMILTAVAAGQDPRLVNSDGVVVTAPTRARSNSGRFNLQRLQSDMAAYSNMAGDAQTAGSVVPGGGVGGVPLLSKVVPHLLCERCYRQLMSAPYTVNADAIQSTGVVALPSHVTPLSAEQVKFTDVLNITQSVDGNISYDGAEVSGAETSAALRAVDFALFDRNLSALLKGQDGKEPSEGKPAAAQKPVAPVAQVAASVQRAIDYQADDPQEMMSSMPPRHGLEGHRIRNSRDLTRKATRPVSTVSAASTSSVSSGGEGKSEELHVMAGGMQELSVNAKVLNDRYQHRALPPDPVQSPTSKLSSPLPPATPQTPSSAGLASPGIVGMVTPPPAPAAGRKTLADASKASPSPAVTPTSAKKSTFELVPFIEQLWEGVNVKILSSGKPMVEKNRVIYLRAGTEKSNKLIRERLVPIGTETTDSHRYFTHKALLDAVAAAVPLQLCWGRRSVIGSVSFSPEKCLDLDTIKHIKVGSGVFAQCVNIGSSTGRALVLKIDDSAAFARILEGITTLVEGQLLENMSAFDPEEVVIPPPGMVSLADKQIPVCERPPPYDEAYAYTRGKVDITAFKAMLKAMPADMWEDENQEGNVRVTRPAHDAWGVKKIVFQFCDDFLLKVLDFPWSQKPEWREFLCSVYDAMGIDESKVVRSLLASIPPGINIPVHHDTGYWVKHTHRCHLAIETGKDVQFKIGPTPELMRKYLFDEGRIVELNNQAKHSVVNNMTDTHRVHLIFDYVDDHPIKQRFKLSPGEVIHQTRRSIDLAREAALPDARRKAPTFVIIGAQKCGTTSMYEYLCQHPLVVRGKRRETHYFDWRYNHALPDSDAAAHLKYYMNFFYADALEKHISLVTGESTPSYLLHSDLVIPRMKLICPWAKLIVMLRNPTERAYSQYQMCVDPTGTPEQLKVRGESTYRSQTFLQVVTEEVAALRAAGVTPDADFEVFREKVLKGLPMNHGGHSIVARGLYALQLAQWMAHWPADQIQVHSISEIKGSKQDVQRTLDGVFSFLDLPPHDTLDLEAKNTRKYEGMPADCRALLDAFYAPYNARLFAMLGKELEW